MPLVLMLLVAVAVVSPASGFSMYSLDAGAGSVNVSLVTSSGQSSPVFQVPNLDITSVSPSLTADLANGGIPYFSL